MHRGEIVLVSGTGLIPWFIKRITKSPFSHAGWIYKDHHVVEANAEGVEALTFPYDVERCSFIKLKVDPAAIEKCLSFAEKQVGKEYDFKLFLGLLWRWLWGSWNRTKKVKDWPSGYICSELVAKPVLEHTGITFTPENVDPQNTVPGDIYTFATANPDKAEATYIGEKVRR